MECFVLLDDCAATEAVPSSRLYTGLLKDYRCECPRRLDEVWREAEREMGAGRHAVLLADYEWGARLLGAGDRNLPSSDYGVLRFLIFSSLRHLSRRKVDEWLAAREQVAASNGVGQGGPADGAIWGPEPAGVFDLRASLGPAEFGDAIARIHEAIEAGETYQVNFSYRLDFRIFGTPVSLYRRLRARQPVPFGALMAVPAGRAGGGAMYVLSYSPELFLRHREGRLQARPMKGTAARPQGSEDGLEAVRHLRTDAKTRAENLMIVDLLRNDLGRIARTGSVRVPTLFAVESHPTLLQMTSTVEAELPADVDFPDVLRATFPCGSVTGAPKHQTMGWIGRLEARPRGLYTGAIGWLDPPGGHRAGAACGDFCLSVPIRTLTLHESVRAGSARGALSGTMGVGAGIVSDSVAADEYAECRLKARFLTDLDPGLSLFETLYASRGEGIRHLDRHLQRLTHSADCLGFSLPLPAIRRALSGAASGLGGAGPYRLRLLLHKDGAFDLSSAPLEPLPEGAVTLVLAREPVAGDDPLLRHKTTHRSRYDRAIAAAERHGAFDALFFNQAGLLTEGGRCNVFLRLAGAWVTPPLAAGVLPGVMRGLLLDDPAWNAREWPIGLGDLGRAERIVGCNALRGVFEARLVDPENCPILPG